jgi:hypothetical protein
MTTPMAEAATRSMLRFGISHDRHGIGHGVGHLDQEGVLIEQMIGKQRPVAVGPFAIAAHDRLDLGAQSLGRPLRFGERLGQPLVMAQEEVQRELLLARKVAVDGALGDRGRHRDLLGRRLGDAARYEQSERGALESRLGIFRLAHTPSI